MHKQQHINTLKVALSLYMKKKKINIIYTKNSTYTLCISFVVCCNIEGILKWN